MEAVKNIWTLKSELKQSAQELRADKAEIKKTQKEHGCAGTLQYRRVGMKRSHRHKHVAYSMMRGRTYEQIEQKCAPDNKADHDLIRSIIDEYTKEDVRACA